MVLREAYPLRLLCRLLEVPRGTLYHRPKGQRGEEGALRVRLRTLAGTWPRYGYRRLGVLLREEGLLLPRPHPKPKTSSSGVLPLGEGGNLLVGLEVREPHPVWVADLSYGVLGEETAYLAVVMDPYTRRVLGLSLGRRLFQGLALVALERALGEGVPRVHPSDRGVQYTSRRYAERLIRAIKEEWVDLREYRTLGEARASVEALVFEVYNRKRPHAALGYLTPVAFAERCLNGGENLT